MTDRQDIQAAIDDLAAKQGVIDSVTPSNLSANQFQVFLDKMRAADESVPTTGATQYIFQESDFPTPVAGVITLVDNTTYKISGNVPMTNRLVMGVNTPVIGEISITSQLVYTGTDTFLTSIGHRIYFKDLAVITTQPASTLISKTGVDFCTFRNYAIFTAGAFGTIETDNDIIFSQGFMNLSGTGIKVGPALTVSYFEFSDARLIQNTANTPFDFSGAAIENLVINETQIVPLGNGPSITADAGSINITDIAQVRNNDFKMANGQAWLAGGLTVKDINWFFADNTGIEVEPSTILGSALLSGNTITTNSTPTGQAVSGAFVVGVEDQRMNSSSGTITNTAGSKLQAILLAQGTVDNTSGGNAAFTFEFFVNGAAVPNVTATVNVDANDQNTWVMVANVKLTLNAQVQVRVSNASSATCVIPDMQFSVQGR